MYWYLRLTNMISENGQKRASGQALNGNGSLNGRVRLVVHQFKILEPETEDILYGRVNFHLW